MRIAVFHNLHSGGALRVTTEHVHRLAACHVVAVYRFANGAPLPVSAASSPSCPDDSVTGYRPIRMLPSPFGRLNPVLGLANVSQLARASRRLAAQIDAGAYDVVLVHPCQVTQTPLLLRWLHTPTLYFCEELPRRLYEPAVLRPRVGRRRWQAALDTVDPLVHAQRAILRWADRQCAQKAAAIATNSRFTRARIAAAYQRDAEVCYPGVELSQSNPLAIKRDRLVLSVGALTPNKGFDFIIEALATLPAAARPPLVIVSNYQEPAELAYLQVLAQQRGVALDCQVQVPLETLHCWYARAGCVACAPRGEPLGLVALEAQAAAAPVVGVAEGGLLETIVPGVTGLLTPRDPRQFGRAIAHLLDHPGEAQQLGQAGRQAVQSQWTWDRHLAQLEPLLFRTADQQRSSR